MTSETVSTRVRVGGKYLRVGAAKFFVKGLSYGPFPPNADGEPFPDRTQVGRDLSHMRQLGANALRVYYPPPIWLLDEAAQKSLRVFVDVPWEKHRCFFEDWSAQQRARESVATAARIVGNHPATMAISVVNEIPVDVIRFYGRNRVERFVEELLDIGKQQAPDCLVTYVNFPTTEFFDPEGADFYCFNVYLHDEAKFAGYLDRLQHLAGNKPLVLGEYGVDTIRSGDLGQVDLLSQHVRQVFRRGLAGSFVFSYTDEWFTGGKLIHDWAFGVTRSDRTEKPGARALQRAWADVPAAICQDTPRVSVVVCSYNGAQTLASCLDSLMRLDYPDYEVILVDDGSTDDTPAIAAEFPQVVYHRQDNHGLSVARNVGARLASGEVVAYTDSDCVVDEHWLTYLIEAMRDQQVEAIGGPNITPPSDGWVAKCVAASPGNPSHVMLDDRHAEHVPGCNMAFRRATLLGLGGFDAQFRQAGDDVDLCWRMLDAGLPIGYASGAMVWHHRRATVRAYANQQKGYGRSEAMVHFKHPHRYGVFGRSRWNGIIYGDGAVGLPLTSPTIYHGRFGSSLFQTIYRHNTYGVWCVVMSLEWHLAALFLLLLAAMFWPLAALSCLMWCATFCVAVRSAANAPLPREYPWWCRPLVACLYVLQPVLRGWYRMTHLLERKQLPAMHADRSTGPGPGKRTSSHVHDLYWDNHQARGREALLESLVMESLRLGWPGDFNDAWTEWDVKLVGTRWHDITVQTATEELGWPRRFTRARIAVIPTIFHNVIGGGCALWCLAALLTMTTWGLVAGVAFSAWVLIQMGLSRQRCLRAAARLLSDSARLARLDEEPTAAPAESLPIAPSACELTERRPETARRSKHRKRSLPSRSSSGSASKPIPFRFRRS